MIKVGTIRFKGRCEWHADFDPLHGQAGIRGGCRRCQLLLEIHEAHGRLVELIRKAKNEAGPAARRAAAAGVDDRQSTLF